MTKKLSAKTFLLFVTYIACAVLFFGKFDGMLTFGLYVGALYSTTPLIAFVIYALSSVVYGWTALLHTAVRGAIMLAFWFGFKLARKKINKGALFTITVISNIFYVVYGNDSYFDLFDKLLYVIVGIAFCYVSVYVFRTLFVRGLQYKPAQDEKICIAIYVIVAVYCLSGVQLQSFNLLYLFVPFSLLFCQSVFGDKVTLTSAVLIGLGNILQTGSYDVCAFSVICALTIVTLIKVNRYVASIGVIVVDVLMSYFVNLHGSFSTVVFAPTLVSTFIYVVVPSSAYNYLNDLFGGNNDKYLNVSVTKRLGNGLSRRLYRLSDIFLSMKNAYFAMSSGKITPQEAQNAIVKECSERICRECSNRTRCWRQELTQTEQVLLKLSNCAVNRGKCSILDVPQTLSVKCDRVSAVISEVNNQAQLYRDYLTRTEQADNNKMLLGEQMGGVSNLLLQLATDCKSKETFDHTKEQELVERLVFHNVMCVGATVVQQGAMITIVITVSRKDVNRETIERVCSALFKQTVVVDKVEDTDSPSWVNVSLSVKPHYAVTFGVSATTKNGSEISGDTYSVINTDNGKCIIALCDGMGSGNKAEQMSSTAISLIESFYRAGFDNDAILSCVNKVLSGCNNDVFCAVDVVVFDLYNGLADFIKLGATIGLVKNKDTVEVIRGSSLPLGVLDEMKPSVTPKALYSGDVIVLLSDGVVDCFSDVNDLAGAFQQCAYSTAQTIAETILNKAVKLCQTPNDDMTVLVAKIS